MVPSGTVKRRPTPKRHGQKKRVLFVCLGNSCRSQMAEAFARAYGSDVLIPVSAGIIPAIDVAPLTIQVLAEKNIRADKQFPKSLDQVTHERFDLIVNMSGSALPHAATKVVEWPVEDPIGQKPEVYRNVANQIEGLVMNLILNLRSKHSPS